MTAEATKSMDELAEALGISKSAAFRRAKLLPDSFFISTGSRRKLRASCFFEAAARLSHGTPVDVSPPPEPRSDTSDELDGPEPEYSLGRERARREHFEAERAKLKFLTEKRALVPAKETRRRYVGALRQVTARVLEVPGQIAAEVVVMRDPFQVEALMDRALRVAIESARLELVEGEAAEATPAAAAESPAP